MNAGEPKPIVVEKPARPVKADMATASRQKALQAEYDAAWSTEAKGVEPRETVLGASPGEAL